jgi:hypothetical protein
VHLRLGHALHVLVHGVADEHRVHNVLQSSAHPEPQAEKQGVEEGGRALQKPAKQKADGEGASTSRRRGLGLGTPGARRRRRPARSRP